MADVEYTFGASLDTNGASDSTTNSDDFGTDAGFLRGIGGSGGGDSGNVDAHGTEFDPDIHSGGKNRDGSWRKKRGRKSGGRDTGNSGKRKARANSGNTVGVEYLAQMLGIVHLGIAAVSKTPELALKDEEAEALAKATAVVLDEFDIQPDPRVTAVVGLVTTATTIYGPKIYFIRERKKQERERDVE